MRFGLSAFVTEWGRGLLVVGEVVQVAHTAGVAQLGEETREVERLAAEDDFPLTAGPLLSSAVPGKLDAVEVGIVQVDRFVGAVVGSAIDAPAGVEQPDERGGEVAP